MTVLNAVLLLAAIPVTMVWRVSTGQWPSVSAGAVAGQRALCILMASQRLVQFSHGMIDATRLKSIEVPRLSPDLSSALLGRLFGRSERPVDDEFPGSAVVVEAEPVAGDADFLLQPHARKPVIGVRDPEGRGRLAGPGARSGCLGGFRGRLADHSHIVPVARRRGNGRGSW